MNRYPIWKYLLLAFIALIGLIYASPILFPSDYAIQVSAQNNIVITDKTLERVQKRLTDEKLETKKVALEGEKVVVRFNDADTQLKAAEVLRNEMGEDDYVVALSLADTTPAWLSSLGAKNMYLGLDLRGGVHFLMEVDMDAAVEKAYVNYEDSFRKDLREEQVSYLGVIRQQNSVQVKFKDEDTLAQGLRVLQKTYRESLDFDEVAVNKGFAFNASMKDTVLLETKRFALKQNITTLRNRVNELGVAEPVIQQQGLDRIIVQLPGIQDTGRAKTILGATATLEFRHVNDGYNPFDAQASGRAPSGSKLYKEKDGNPILLSRRVIISGDSITNAAAIFDQNNQPAVSISLDGKGGKRMLEFTTDHIQERMGVVFIETKIKQDVVNGEKKITKRKKEEVINAATIQGAFGNSFQITGLDSAKESHNLALLLRAGSLAAPVYIVEERTVGPSLGAANIDAGFKSVIIGFILVLIFMVYYYRVFGLVANLALALNLVLIVAALSLMQATLTLPGIAGIVLTVGMAVDANVLIYERIREELRAGVSPQKAIDAGYEKAFSTITDANITTFIAAVVLFMFGTGPIKGFAVTLAIGIISSMYTAIVGTRAIINLIYGGRKVKQLNIGLKDISRGSK